MGMKVAWLWRSARDATGPEGPVRLRAGAGVPGAFRPSHADMEGGVRTPSDSHPEEMVGLSPTLLG
jgi:hypothetical protein